MAVDTDCLSSDELHEAVKGILVARASDAALTPKDVRLALERQLGVPKDALHTRRGDILKAIESSMKELKVSSSEVDPAELKETIAMLEGECAAEVADRLIVAALDGKSSALVLLAEACAASETVSRALCAARIGRKLHALLGREAPAQQTALALRLLSAICSHRNAQFSETLLKDGLLSQLLVLLDTTGAAENALRVAALMHALADSRASRFRLIHGGALRCLTRAVVEPTSSGSLKEHCLQAAASIAGRPDDEVSLPSLLGDLCAEKLPGTQSEAVAALTILAEKQPQVRGRLLSVTEVRAGLEIAAAAADTKLATEAAQLIEMLSRTSNQS